MSRELQTASLSHSFRDVRSSIAALFAIVAVATTASGEANAFEFTDPSTGFRLAVAARKDGRLCVLTPQSAIDRAACAGFESKIKPPPEGPTTRTIGLAVASSGNKNVIVVISWQAAAPGLDLEGDGLQSLHDTTVNEARGVLPAGTPLIRDSVRIDRRNGIRLLDVELVTGPADAGAGIGGVARMFVIPADGGMVMVVFAMAGDGKDQLDTLLDASMSTLSVREVPPDSTIGKPSEPAQETKAWRFGRLLAPFLLIGVIGTMIINSRKNRGRDS